jgi:methionyl-tRNA synthetase
MKNKYYITTTLPYVNAKPHIGTALEFIQADALARYQRLVGNEVIFNTGTDEHGLKVYRKAQELGLDTLEYCTKCAAEFDALKELLNLSYTNFIRTTDEHHEKAAQEFWMKSFENGDIYKKNYQVKYCVGCELEKTDSELEGDRCPIHPNLEIEIIDEENYFFKFSKYQNALLELYKENKEFVIPAHRQKEIENFVKQGLKDFSISRLKEKMPWGVAVPNDEEHVMYVWFDALINYISTIGWPNDIKKYKSLWPGVQVAGKDNLRQQTAMWQAMLMSAGLPPSKQVFIHGFITSGGQKMSKSLGNVIDPYEIVTKYGVDATRYYLLGELPSNEDGDFTIEKFEEFYTAHLVNGIGNLTSRILAMLEKYNESKVPAKSKNLLDTVDFWDQYEAAFARYDFHEIVRYINRLVSSCDELISTEKPWEKTKAGEDISQLLYVLAEGLRHIAIALLPIIPATAEKILDQLNTEERTSLDWGKLEKDGIIKKEGILFERLEK